MITDFYQCLYPFFLLFLILFFFFYDIFFPSNTTNYIYLISSTVWILFSACHLGMVMHSVLSHLKDYFLFEFHTKLFLSYHVEKKTQKLKNTEKLSRFPNVNLNFNINFLTNGLDTTDFLEFYLLNEKDICKFTVSHSPGVTILLLILFSFFFLWSTKIYRDITKEKRLKNASIMKIYV